MTARLRGVSVRLLATLFMTALGLAFVPGPATAAASDPVCEVTTTGQDLCIVAEPVFVTSWTLEGQATISAGSASITSVTAILDFAEPIPVAIDGQGNFQIPLDPLPGCAAVTVTASDATEATFEYCEPDAEPQDPTDGTTCGITASAQEMCIHTYACFETGPATHTITGTVTISEGTATIDHVRVTFGGMSNDVPVDIDGSFVAVLDLAPTDDPVAVGAGVTAVASDGSEVTWDYGCLTGADDGAPELLPVLPNTGGDPRGLAMGIALVIAGVASIAHGRRRDT